MNQPESPNPQNGKDNVPMITLIVILGCLIPLVVIQYTRGDGDPPPWAAGIGIVLLGVVIALVYFLKYRWRNRKL